MKENAMFNHKMIFLPVLMTLLLLSGCGEVEITPTPIPTAMPVMILPTSISTLNVTQPTPTMTAISPSFSNPYLGQTPPGMEPEIFAPGIVSDPDFREYSGTFSPDGREYYFYRFTEDSPLRFLYSRFLDGQWTIPEDFPVTAEYGASEPHITFDNKRLYFMWRHPVPEGQPNLPSYYFVERTPDGWTEPKYAGQGMFMSSDRNGEIFTTNMSMYDYGTTYLAKVITVDGVFANYERLEIQPRLGRQAHPCIAPDGSYMLFDVEGGNHLFVSFKKADGSWGEAIDLVKHGFDRLAGGAYISPDGKYLFFSLNGDIWWVDIGVVESLRPVE